MEIRHQNQQFRSSAHMQHCHASLNTVISTTLFNWNWHQFMFFLPNQLILIHQSHFESRNVSTGPLFTKEMVLKLFGSFSNLESLVHEMFNRFDRMVQCIELSLFAIKYNYLFCIGCFEWLSVWDMIRRHFRKRNWEQNSFTCNKQTIQSLKVDFVRHQRKILWDA